MRVDSTNFATINAGLAAQFTAFSAKKLFMPVGTNQVEIDFKVVGTETNGLVKSRPITMARSFSRSQVPCSMRRSLPGSESRAAKPH